MSFQRVSGVQIPLAPAASLMFARLSGDPPKIVAFMRAFAGAREPESRPILMLEKISRDFSPLSSKPGPLARCDRGTARSTRIQPGNPTVPHGAHFICDSGCGLPRTFSTFLRRQCVALVVFVKSLICRPAGPPPSPRAVEAPSHLTRTALMILVTCSAVDGRKAQAADQR